MASRVICDYWPARPGWTLNQAGRTAAFAHHFPMSSWRDAATPECQADLDGLLNQALPLAKHMLDLRGGFYPGGFAITTEGQTRLLAAYEGPEFPASDDMLALLIRGVQASRDELRATAFFCDVRLPDVDAIRVELEHRDGPAIAVLLPYQRAGDPAAQIQYLPLRASEGRRQIW